MKVRTPLELNKRLGDDLGWRRKEIAFYRSWASRAEHRQAVLRGAVAVLYAHWEGFVKTGSQAYLEFVGTRGIPFLALRPCFMAIAARAKLKQTAASTWARQAIELVEFLESQWAAPVSWVPSANAISTRERCPQRLRPSRIVSRNVYE